MKPQPVPFEWREVEIVDPETGAFDRVMAMVPLPQVRKACDRRFGRDGTHLLAPINERSLAQHNHYFAALHGYYTNLPETISARWTSEEHFRKWCLVECGWFTEKEFDMESDKHAKRLAAFIRPEDIYAHITTRGKTVIVRRARSQAFDAMDKEEFTASSKAVLELAESFVGVKPTKMAKEAGRYA